MWLSASQHCESVVLLTHTSVFHGPLWFIFCSCDIKKKYMRRHLSFVYDPKRVHLSVVVLLADARSHTVQFEITLKNLFCLMYRTESLAFLCVVPDNSLVNSKPNEWEVYSDSYLEEANVSFELDVLDLVRVDARAHRRLWNRSALCFQFLSF